MKRRSFVTGMLVVLLAFGLVFVGCDNPSGSSSGSNTGGNNTGGGNTGGNNTGGNNTGGDNTGGGNTGGDNTGGDNTGGDNTGGDNTGGDNTGGDNTGGGLQQVFEGIPVNYGVTQAVQASTLIANLSKEFAKQSYSWSEFVAAGYELYVNDQKVTSGSTMIQPSATVRVMAPADGDDDYGDGDHGDGGNTGGGLQQVFEGIPKNYGVTQAVSASTLIANLSQEFAERSYNWSEFVAAGCELYVDDQKVTSGSTMIQPSAIVTVLAPEGIFAP
jgi:hypothetical protein